MATRSRSDRVEPDRAEPTPITRRRLNPDQRRRELLEAAVRVLRRRGPTDCRVEDITTEAGTAKGNFYRYFQTWDDLLIAVRDHLINDYAQDLRDRFAARNPIDWWIALEEEIDRFIDFQLGLGGLHDAAFHGPAGQARPITGEQSAAALIAGFLAAGIAANAFADLDVEPTAVLLFHLLHGAADEIRAGAAPTEMRRAALHIIQRTLAPTPAPSDRSDRRTTQRTETP